MRQDHSEQPLCPALLGMTLVHGARLASDEQLSAVLCLLEAATAAAAAAAADACSAHVTIPLQAAAGEAAAAAAALRGLVSVLLSEPCLAQKHCCLPVDQKGLLWPASVSADWS